MLVVVQRVSRCQVSIREESYSEIGKGLLILLGIEENDGSDDILWLVNKILNLRIFNDSKGVMNLSSLDVNGDLMVVSQFTLHASTRKGNRPSYMKAANPEIAVPVYNHFVESLKDKNPGRTESGEFGADMKVELVNDGPVTLIIDSKNRV